MDITRNFGLGSEHASAALFCPRAEARRTLYEPLQVPAPSKTYSPSTRHSQHMEMIGGINARTNGQDTTEHEVKGEHRKSISCFLHS